MCDIIDHYTATNPTRKPLFIADRGFVSFNVFAHAIENNAYFLVRARESNPRSMLATIKLPGTTRCQALLNFYKHINSL